MRHRPSITFVMLAILAVLVPAADAQAQRRGKFRAGDPVPELSIESWYEGRSAAVEDGQVTMVIFFDAASIEGAVLTRMMSDLQTMLRGRSMQVIGVTEADESDVRDLMRAFPPDADISIGFDAKGKTTKNWVNNFDVSDSAERRWKDASHHVFLVDGDKKLQWTGQVSEDMMTVTVLMLDGRFNAEAFRRARPLFAARDDARKVRNWRLYDQHLTEILEIDKRVFALATIEKFEAILIDQNDTEKAYAYAATLAETYATDPSFLIQFAFEIADTTKIRDDQRDLEFAQKLVDAAMSQVGNSDTRVLDAAARVAHAKGELDAATRHIRRAYRIAPPLAKPYFKKTLDEYSTQLRQARNRVGG